MLKKDDDRLGTRCQTGHGAKTNAGRMTAA
jgi:hypothetical protein